MLFVFDNILALPIATILANAANLATFFLLTTALVVAK